MSYYVIEQPCPDCDGKGHRDVDTIDTGRWPVILELNCLKCFTTGWIEVYRHGPDEGSSVAVEVPDSPSPSGAGRRPVPV